MKKIKSLFSNVAVPAAVTAVVRAAVSTGLRRAAVTGATVVAATAGVTAVTTSSSDAACRGLIPDVSSFQGHPNWSAAKSCGIAGGIAKAGEFVEDPDFVFNWDSLRSLHVWHAPYWFVRNTGCAHEGAEYVAILRSVGYQTDPQAGPPILDMEVPESLGYAPCLDRILFAAFHRHAVIYTAPGTWPGGSAAGLPLWIATYGSGFDHSFGPSRGFGPVVAWQCTDGQFGCVHDIPGIGRDDVSVDLGITKLVAAPPPDPYRFFDKTVRHFADKVHGSEYVAVKGWDAKGCKEPVRRHVCVWTASQLTDLAGRLWFVAHNHLLRGSWVRNAIPTWSLDHRGLRFQGLWHRLHPVAR